MKKKAAIYIIVMLLVIATGFSVSYAFYTGTLKLDTGTIASTGTILPECASISLSNENTTLNIIGDNIAPISDKKALSSDNYKYELLQDGVVVSSGDFSNVGMSTNMKIMPMTKLNPVSFPQTYTYELYIWLSENDTNQNNLMNKVFNAKLNVNSAIKK